MVEIKHTPVKDKDGVIICDNHYTISGDNIEEIIEKTVSRIDPKSQEFYRAELKKDLLRNGWSVVSHHASFGTHYKINYKSVN